MKTLLSICSLLCMLASAAPVSAAPILTLERTGPGLVAPGALISFELKLFDTSTPIGAYSVGISYNNAVLSLLPPVGFGNFLGDPLLEAFAVADTATDGIVRLDEVSLLDSNALQLRQENTPGSSLFGWLLATLNFQAHGGGAGQVAFIDGSLTFANADGVALPPPAASALDAVFVVPEPGTLLLLALGLLAIAAATRRSGAPASTDDRSGNDCGGD